jgi:hypothetical protein
MMLYLGVAIHVPRCLLYGNTLKTVSNCLILQALRSGKNRFDAA